MHKNKRCVLGFLILWGLAAGAAAQKTDVVEMSNGDHYTGEIKGYYEGRLSLDTWDAGVISIKWNKIQSITSNKVFDIELIDGTHVFGSLAPSKPPGDLAIVAGGTSLTIEYFAVARMNPLYQSFWRRMTGSFDLGFNYTQANQFVQFNVNGTATYRVKSFELETTLNAFFSKQSGTVSSQRAAFGFDYQYFLKRRWFLGGLLGFERNQDLGLNLRSSVGGGGGRYVIQTNRSSLAVLVGAIVNREQPVEGDTLNGAEALLAIVYSTFMYDFPKLSFDTSLKVFPSFTESGRLRLQFNASARREIISDFYVSISLFDTFDSQPPTEGASKNDWGPVLSIGYNF